MLKCINFILNRIASLNSRYQIQRFIEGEFKAIVTFHQINKESLLATWLKANDIKTIPTRSELILAIRLKRCNLINILRSSFDFTKCIHSLHQHYLYICYYKGKNLDTRNTSLYIESTKIIKRVVFLMAYYITQSTNCYFSDAKKDICIHSV